MRLFRTSFFLLLVTVVVACGVSKDKQDRMRFSLHRELNESFINDSILLPSVDFIELKEVEKNRDHEIGEYKASFVFSFKNFWDNEGYDIRGDAYFDEYGDIIKSDGKKSIHIYLISKNHRAVSSEEMKSLRPKDIHLW